MSSGLGRWVAKKGARLGMAAAGLSPLGRVQNGGSPRVRVLTYHRFGSIPRDPFCVRRDVFEAQMRWLADTRRAVSLEDVEDLLAGEEDVRDGGVLVTIDDGCRSTALEALPVLRDHGIPAVVYLVAGSIGRGRGVDRDQPEDYMTWRDVDALLASGVVTIGSHAYHHRSLGRMEPARAREEAVRSRELLERRIGQDVLSFAYPFGTLRDFGPHTEQALAEAGYTTGFTSQHGPITPSAEPLRLPRVKIEGGEPLWAFRSACDGGLDAWGHVDRALHRLQTPV